MQCLKKIILLILPINKTRHPLSSPQTQPPTHTSCPQCSSGLPSPTPHSISLQSKAQGSCSAEQVHLNGSRVLAWGTDFSSSLLGKSLCTGQHIVLLEQMPCKHVKRAMQLFLQQTNPLRDTSRADSLSNSLISA